MKLHQISPINKWLAKNKKPEVKKKVYTRVSARGEKLSLFHSPDATAKEAENAFDDDNLIFEIKWDGYRAIAEDALQHDVKFYSRNGISF